MMPEPTTAARRNAVPRNSAAKRDRRATFLFSDRVDFFLQRETIESGERKVEKETDPSVQQKKGVAKSFLDLVFRSLNGSWIGDAPVRRHWLPRQMGQTSLAALSQTVKTKSSRGASGLENSLQLLLRRPVVGKCADSS